MSGHQLGGDRHVAAALAHLRAARDDTQHAHGINPRAAGAVTARGAQPPSPPAVLERWPRLEDLWRYCRQVDAWVNRGLTEDGDA